MHLHHLFASLIVEIWWRSSTRSYICSIPSITERLTGPRDCSLVGLSTDWAAFRWHHGSISCGLGELIGYELSLASLGQDAQLSGNEELPADEIFVKRYRTDSFTTSIVAQDLRPGFKYRAQVRPHNSIVRIPTTVSFNSCISCIADICTPRTG